MQTKLSFHFIVLLSLLLAALPAQAAPAASAAPTGLLQFSAGGHALGFTAEGMYAATGTHDLHVDFAGSNSVRPQADSPANPSSLRQAQDDASLRTGSDGKAAPLSRVTYAHLWNGIDLTYTAEAGSIYTTTYSLAPGANPADIRLRYNAPLTLNKDGTLSTAFETGRMTESAPLAWQEIQGQRVSVDVSFQIHGQEVSFVLGSYDPRYALTIDPSLVWNTFLGASGTDIGNGIAVDGSGNVYVTGYSDASWGGPMRAYNSNQDAFAAKLSSTGGLVWNTFLGGSGTDIGNGIAVDGSGNVYVTGDSSATWGSPVRLYTSGNDAFAAKLSPSGGLTWNTFLGGDGSDTGYGIAVDGSGNVTVTGQSSATWGNPARLYTSGADAFAAKLDTSGGLTWNTFLGASGDDYGYGIAVDGGGDVYVTGYSDATWGTPMQSYTGGTDAFAAKLYFSTGALTWNTFLGGSGEDVGRGIAVDGGGNVYVTGQSSATWGIPVRDYTGGADAFAAQLFSSSGLLIWNTFLGGSGDDYGYGIAMDGSGNVYVAGFSNATWGSPVRAYTSGNDAFAAKLSPSGGLTSNTFLGGSGDDKAGGIAMDGSGNIYVTGTSDDTWGSPDPEGGYFSGGYDAFATKVDLHEYTLTITSAHGTVAESPAQSTYHYGDVVQLTATANAGWRFVNWTGDLTGSVNPDSVVIHGNTSVTANYTLIYLLSVSKTGSGSGTVTSAPGGITCGATCSYSFDYNTAVTLTATAATDSSFTGWTGSGCSGTGTCTVTMSAASSVTANFTLTYLLSVSKTGSGSGTVTSAPAGITCGATCSASFLENASVTLTATAATGSTFMGWGFSGCSTGTCTVIMSSARSVTAHFTLNTYLLSVSKTGSGSGTVTSNPAGIHCGATCSYSFDYNTAVTLTATAVGGSTFTGWSGSGCTGTGTCTVIMSAARSVTANFTILYQLIVSKAGSGSGTLTSSPAGITCGSTCYASFLENTSVTLTAAAATGSTFTGWSGSGCAGIGTCTVTMSGARLVTATFTLTYLLSVSKTGTGSGIVDSAPGGISCGATCSASFLENAYVTLTASAAGGSTFTGWSGSGCSGTGTCTVIMSAARSVTANFTIVYQLIVSKGGNLSGTLTSSPAGITCGSTCYANFAENTSVTLTATAATGSTFTGWSGSGCSGTGTCTVTMDANKNVTAFFTLNTYLLSVSKTGTGSGTVTSAPGGITCGATCSYSFDYNTAVTLTATAATGSTFTGWSGSGCSGTGTCTVIMSSAGSVTASFTLNTYLLSVSKTGSGSGTVTSAPTGITCGSDCSETYNYNTSVTLTATAATGSTFTGWSGRGCSGTGTCIVTVTAAASVTATFTLNTYLLSVSKTGTGSGTVTSSPGGITCGATCSHSFNYNTSVTLTATAATGSTFTGWSGSGCSGTGTCIVTMNTARSVTATFTLNTYRIYLPLVNR